MTAMDASRLELQELLAGLSQEEALSHIKALKATLGAQAEPERDVDTQAFDGGSSSDESRDERTPLPSHDNKDDVGVSDTGMLSVACWFFVFCGIQV